jgi:hypothetical protein
MVPGPEITRRAHADARRAAFDGSIVLLDLATGERVSGPHGISVGGVSSLALVQAGGPRVVVCGALEYNWYGPRAWDLDQARAYPGALQWRQASGFIHLASSRAQGRDVVVVGDSGGFVGLAVPELAELEDPPRKWRLPDAEPA